MKTKKTKVISVVIPAYNEELNVRECYSVLKDLFETQIPKYDFELIFCDNSSTDRTREYLEKIAKNDERVKLIFNTANFGALKSLYNGLLSTTGDAVIPFMPADMQDPPDIIPEFIKYWEKGYKVVYGQRAVREEGFIIKSLRKIYYRAIRKFSNIDIPVDSGEFQLIDIAVVKALREEFDDHYPYLRGMIAMTGFKSVGVKYTWKARKRGKSKISFLSLIDQALNGFVSTTNFPMRIGMLFGGAIAFLSMLYTLFGIIYYFASPEDYAERGIMTIIVAIFFFGGIIIFYLSVIGEYIASIHSQVRKRPMVVEEKRINF